MKDDEKSERENERERKRETGRRENREGALLLPRSKVNSFSFFSFGAI
jgi:hypothetical protein